jgi:predicted nucleic acid-binding Zn ribbon protein
MRRLSNLMPEAIDKHEILRAARAMRVLRRWEEAVGPLLAARSHPDRYDRGTVWVSVQGAAWAQELRMIKDQILGRLRAMAPEEDLFVNLRFGVRELPEAEKAPAPRPSAAEHRLRIENLSIEEIRERRLRAWADEERD